MMNIFHHVPSVLELGSTTNITENPDVLLLSLADLGIAGRRVKPSLAHNGPFSVHGRALGLNLSLS